MQTAAAAQKALHAVANPERAISTYKFFKAYPGGYSEGDEFLGCTVPVTRLVAKQFYGLPLSELEVLLTSKWHDERLLALIILVRQYQKGNAEARKAAYDFYMVHIINVNNWDLVDSSASYIVGPYLDGRPEKMQVLQKLAMSETLWERRVAMVATFYYIKKGRADEALLLAEQLINDKHDLIQKAVGWMLREVGKRVDREPLLLFLDRYAATMPRITLRYAIEHLALEQRMHYMRQKALQ